MKKELAILKPDVRTIYLKNRMAEQVKYIEVPDNVNVTDLKNDIKNGAVHMKDLEALVKKKKESKYIVVTAQDCEKGFLAISYLAACFNAKDFMVDYTSEDVGSETPEIVESNYSLLEDLFSDDYEENDESSVNEEWVECDNRIPIINISEMMEEYSPFGNDHLFGNDNYRVGMRNRNMNDRERYWQNCTNSAVCIVVNDLYCGNDISDSVIGAIEYFKNNKKVYILTIDRSMRYCHSGNPGFSPFDDFAPEDDGFFISHEEKIKNQLILGFSADDVKIVLEKEHEKKYYREVLRSHILKNGMGVKKGFSYDKIINIILAMNSEKNNDLIEKVFKYSLKDKEIEEGYQFANEDFAFIDRFARTTAAGKKENDRPAKERLAKELIGMEEIKQQVMDVVNMVKFNRLRESKGIKGSKYHNVHVMLGAPGTAKTTVAKLMGQIMVEEKLLADNRFICVNGAELKGMFVGFSAPKTKAIFDNNDIIFIDEAYSLIDANGEADCFSNEVLAQLAIELENHADDRLVIFAGYGGKDVSEKNNRMKLFLDSNPGIKSRITSTFLFESYNADEMLDIFYKIAKNEHYKVQSGAEEELKRYFESRRTDDNFGNGREARSLLEGSLLEMSRRLFEKKGEKKLSASDMQLIHASDIRLAIEKAARANAAQKGRSSKMLGFR